MRPKPGDILLVHKFLGHEINASLYAQVCSGGRMDFVCGDKNDERVQRWLRSPLGWGVCFNHRDYKYTILRGDDVPDEYYVMLAKRALLSEGETT